MDTRSFIPPPREAARGRRRRCGPRLARWGVSAVAVAFVIGSGGCGYDLGQTAGTSLSSSGAEVAAEPAASAVELAGSVAAESTLTAVPGLDTTSTVIAPPPTLRSAETLLFLKWGADQAEVGMVGGQESRRRGPVSFDLSTDGLIYVLDGVNHRVQCFSPDGAFLRSSAIESKDPTDIVAVDGGFVIDDTQGSGCYELYDGRGSRVASTSLPGGMASAYLWKKEGVVYALLGLDEERQQSGFVPVYAGGRLFAVAATVGEAREGRPLGNGASGFVRAIDGQVGITVVQGENVHFERILTPNPEGPVVVNRAENGKVVATSLVRDRAHSSGLLCHIWVFDGTGASAEIDLAAHEPWTYVHVDARLTSDGYLYSLETAPKGATLSRLLLE